MVDRYSAWENGQDRSTIFVNCKQQVAISSKIDVGDISSMGEGERIARVLDQVENRHSIAHW